MFFDDAKAGKPAVDNKIRFGLFKGILWVKWGAEIVTEEKARAVLAGLGELSKGSVFPLIFELQGIRSVEYRARKAFAAGPWPVTRAALVATSTVDRTAAYFFLSRHPTVCETALFVSLPEAMAWVRGNPGSLRTTPDNTLL
ncbi:DUF7793 family protein [Arthrobacter sp. D3-16]